MSDYKYSWGDDTYIVNRKKDIFMSEEEYKQRRNKAHENLKDIGLFNHVKAIQDVVKLIDTLTDNVHSYRISRLELLRLLNGGDIELTVTNPHRYKEDEPDTITLVFDGDYKNTSMIKYNGGARYGFFTIARNSPASIIDLFEGNNKEKARKIVNQISDLSDIYNKLDRMRDTDKWGLVANEIGIERRESLSKDICGLDVEPSQAKPPETVEDFLRLVVNSTLLLYLGDKPERIETLLFLESDEVKQIYKKCNVQTHIKTIKENMRSMKESVKEMNQGLGEEMPRETTIVEL